MFRIDDTTAIAVKPAPTPEGAPGYFTKGDPLGGIPATVLTADWANAIQEEVISVITDPAVLPAIAPNKAAFNQLVTAIKRLIGIQATETVKGVAEIATQAETDAGTDDARFVTSKKQRNGFAISLGANGYMFLPTWLSGWGMQWGSVSTTPNPSAGQTVNFPITFPNACRVVVAVSNNLTGPFNGEYLTVSGWDTIKFVATYTCGRHYIAIGN